MPTFSVIIPTYGRPDQLRNCLDTLVEVDPPDGGFEVVIVDDGTPEPLEPQLRPWMDRLRADRPQTGELGTRTGSQSGS